MQRRIVQRLKKIFGASICAVVVPTRASDQSLQLQIAYAEGYPDDGHNRWQMFPLHTNLPSANAFRERTPFWIDDLAEKRKHFWLWNEVFEEPDVQSVAALPLLSNGKILGTISVSFDHVHNFDDIEREWMMALASYCASALDRAQMDGEAREVSRQQTESLDLLHSIFDSAPVGFALFDRDGRYVLLNQTMANINELPIQAHIGKVIGELSAGPEQNQPILGTVQRVWQTGKSSGEISVDIPALRGESVTRHCLATFYPVRLKNGEMLGVGAVVTDISDQTRVEREHINLCNDLETERARFEAILQQIPSAVIIAEAPSGRLVLGNSQVERVLGRPYTASSDVDNYNEYKGFHPDGRIMEAADWPLARALTKGEVITGEEFLVPRDDDTLGVIRANAAPVRDRNNKITAGVVIFDDVTQTARASAAQSFLSEAGAILVSTLDEHLALEHLAQLCVPRTADWCLLVVPGPDDQLKRTTVAFSNDSLTETAQKWKRLLAQTELLEPPLENSSPTQRTILLDDGGLEAWQAHNSDNDYAHLFNEVGAHSAIVTPLAARGREAGILIWIFSDSKRSYDQADAELAEEFARRIALSIDNVRLLQEAQKARDEAQKARDEAQGANLAKDQFLAVVSHELRTPLTPIMGWLELLRAPDVNEAIRAQAYEVIERNVNTQAQLVNDILDVSRITTGKLRLEFNLTVFQEIVTLAIETMRPVIESRNLTLVTRLETLPPFVADANRLQQIVSNLLQNAMKFTPDGGRIEITLSSDVNQKRAFLRITDTGVGIAPEFLSQVFERFRQADSSSTRRMGGLGLGLSIVRHLVELHNGEVAVQSSGVGHGATFIVQLPMRKIVPAANNHPREKVNELQNIERPQPQPTQVVTRRKWTAFEGREKLRGLRALLLDEDTDNSEALACLLADMGASVRVTQSTETGKDVGSHFHPDILIANLENSLLEPLDFRLQLRELWPDIPALALGSGQVFEQQKLAHDAGFEDCLINPAGARDLINAIIMVADDSKQ